MNALTKVNRFFLKIFGSRNERLIKEYWGRVTGINELEAGLKELSEERLAGKTAEFRDRLSHGETRDAILPEAFAVVREAARRYLRTPTGLPMRPFDVQLIGGIVLHQGKIAEMATGEGKTLVATLPSYLNALAGNGVHVVTVNDYLAQRDCEWMRPVFTGLEMTVGAIQSGMDSAERKPLYRCDVTYGTNNEFGFDYLRDNMKITKADQVQQARRGFAIVDEVDSILVDEARTPLIISGMAERSSDKYYTAIRVGKRMQRGRHFEVKEKERAVYFTEEGIEFAERQVGVDSFYSGVNMEWPHLLEQSLRALHLFHKDVEYVVREGEVVIVDEFTGRLMEGRTWSDGLHQAIEAKENLEIRKENQTLATITLQNYFKLYSKLAGMTGTALTEAGEFFSIYKLEVVSIPTNKPCQRDDYPDVVYRTAREKYRAIVEEIEAVHEEGRPTLVGTTSIEKTEILAGMLKRRGVAHEVLNAKNHQREAEIVASAGQEGRVTISTNMAGRGTDIVLGPGIADRGGLHVLGTERHEARRIDNQLRGRCARQGDPGSSRFFLCLEDDLMRRFASERVGAILKRLGMKEGEEISHPWVTKSIMRAQKKVEAYHFDVRKNLLEYDQVMNEQRTLIYTQRQDVLEGESLSEIVHTMASQVIRSQANSILTFEPERPPPGQEEDEEPFDPERELREWVRTTYEIELPDDVMSGEFRAVRDRVEAVSSRVMGRYQERYEQRREDNGAEMMTLVERFVLLKLIDDKWKDHLLAMDHLRHSIGLRSYGQIDPKVAYKQEGYQMFAEMLDALHAEVSQMVLRVRVRKEDESDLGTNLQNAEYRHDEVQGGGAASGGGEQQVASGGGAPQTGPPKPIRNKAPKVGRNDPCPCGSGAKYKKCCGVGKK